VREQNGRVDLRLVSRKKSRNEPATLSSGGKNSKNEVWSDGGKKDVAGRESLKRRFHQSRGYRVFIHDHGRKHRKKEGLYSKRTKEGIVSRAGKNCMHNLSAITKH